MDGSKYSDDELLNILVKYNKEVGFPTQRRFVSKNGLPSYTTYFNRFGSFKNAILMSGIDIPQERERYFNREALSDEEMLKLLKHYTDRKLESEIYLMTEEDISLSKNMPHGSTYASRFGGIKNAYKMIGIDYDSFNKTALERDMVEKYKSLCKEMGYTFGSRVMDNLSKEGKFYSSSAVINHFATINEFQEYCGFTPTMIGRRKERQELLDDLIILSNIIGRTPHRGDLKEYDFIAGDGKYSKEFGSWVNALKEAGFDTTRHKILTTKNGSKCRSHLEFKMARVLEINNVDFEMNYLYKNVISDFDRSYSFDFKIDYKGNVYYIEIFGIEGNGEYDKRKEEKIRLCKDNDIPILSYGKDIFWSNTYDDIFNILKESIKSIKVQNKVA